MIPCEVLLFSETFTDISFSPAMLPFSLDNDSTPISFEALVISDTDGHPAKFPFSFPGLDASGHESWDCKEPSGEISSDLDASGSNLGFMEAETQGFNSGASSSNLDVSGYDLK